MSTTTLNPADLSRADAESLTGRAAPAAGQHPWRLHSLAFWLAPIKALLEGFEARMDRYETAQRESEVARYIAANGGQLTDEMEREISRRFGRSAGTW